MHALYFCGDTAVKTVDAYNKWAKDKILSKDVIVHSHVVVFPNSTGGTLIIVVFFDERLHFEWVGQNDTQAKVGQS